MGETMPMNLRKHISVFLICLVAVSALIFSTKVYAADYKDGNNTYTYEELSDGSVKITTFSGNEASITIPNQIDGKAVTCIGEEAFAHHRELTSITIPNSVTSLENNAFYGCSNLTNIGIPGSVKTIGDSVFNSCTSLTSISIPDGVETIGTGVFDECTKLVRVEIGDSVTGIGEKAFKTCTSLKSVKLSGNLTAISDEMFNGCEALTDVAIPGKVTSIGKKAFYVCKALESISLPGSVTSIGVDAFNSCWKLTSVEILGEVTSIEKNAFSGCSRLVDINLPGSVTTIGESAFCGCEQLTGLEIPEATTSIGAWAFAWCYSLVRLEVPDSVTSIGGYAFDSCYNLTIYANNNSYAKSYANTNSIAYSEPCAHSNKEDVITKASFSGKGSIKERCQTCKKVFSTQVINKIEAATLSSITYTYDGSSKEPTVTVTDSVGKELTLGTDYTVTYDNDTRSTGTHKVEVVFAGYYSGTKELNYDITCTHQFTNYVADDDASCIANGHETASCDNGCGKTDTKEIADSSLGHNYKATYNWSTDVKECEIIFTCDREGCKTETDGHSYTKDCNVTAVVTRPVTCAVEGITSYTATYVDGENTYTDMKDVTIARKDHSFEWILDKAATKTVAGSKHEECKVCGYKKTSVVIPIIKVSKSQKITTTKIGKIKVNKLKKKSVTIKLKAKTDGKGKLTYTVVKYPKGMKKFIKVSKTGVVTLKKKAKKGTYKIKITAAANGDYKQTTKIVTINVK